MTIMPLKSISNTRFFTNFKLSIKSNKKMLTVISILHLLGLPVLAATFVVAVAVNGDVGMSGASFVAISIFCLCAAFFCGIIIAVNNFSYLYKKSQVDMIYSLPIKRRHKFLSDYFAGLTIYILPFIIACIIANLIIFSGGICVNELKELIQEENIFPFIFQGELLALIVMTMLYTLSVLVLCCCGTLFESTMNIFMINGLIPGAIAVIAAMFFANLYGVQIFETIVPMLGYTSPIGAMIYGVYILEDSAVFYSENLICINAATYGKWILFLMLFTAIYFTISMFLYEKRKAEDVSKPYVYKMLYYALITVIAMAISLIARYEISMIFPVIIFSLIVYMIFEVITNRGFKKIHKSFIRYAVTMVGIFILCVTAIGTHGFGVEGKTYSPAKIKSVEINYSGIDDVMEYYEHHTYYSYNGYNIFLGEGRTIKYADKDIIETVLDVQKQALETYRNDNKNTNTYSKTYDLFDGGYLYEVDSYTSMDSPMYTVTFKFNLKTGGTTTREYTLSYEQLKQLFILDKTEQMAEYKTKILKDHITTTNYNANDRAVKSYNLSYSLLANYYDKSIIVDLSNEEAKELLNCYKQDYLKATTDDFLKSRVICYIDGYMPIRESFEKTVSFIKSKSAISLADSTITNNLSGTLYSPKGYQSFGRDDITATFGYIQTKDSMSHSLTSEQVLKLLKYASSYYYTEEDCYVMEIYGNYYVIPLKYNEIAEKIYNESINNDSRYTFDELVTDMNNVSSASDYIEQYLDGDYDYYEDINKAYNLICFDSNSFQYELLNTYLGFQSSDDYINYAEENEMSYSSNDVERDWNYYSKEFPMLSSNILY